MSATTVMLVAFGALIIGHWAHNQPTLSVKTVLEMGFAIVVIAMLDQGRTEDIARGFAWLFLAAVLLRGDSVLTGLAKAANAPGNNPKNPPAPKVQAA